MAKGKPPTSGQRNQKLEPIRQNPFLFSYSPKSNLESSPLNTPNQQEISKLNYSSKFGILPEGNCLSHGI